MPPALDLQPEPRIEWGDEWRLQGDRRARHHLRFMQPRWNPLALSLHQRMIGYSANE